MTDPDRPAPDWIAVDWGITHLRAYAMGPEGIMAEVTSEDGISRVTPDACESALLGLVERWLTPDRRTPVIACGMVGSRQGWTEAPYRKAPCRPVDPAACVSVPSRDARLDLRLVPGLKQDKPADVMRGEECQIAGALALWPGFDGVICLPGTHSKWAHVSAGEVVSFQTFLTGEIFALLSEQSILRHAMDGPGHDPAAFADAVAETLSRPERLAAHLFRIRAESLLSDLPPDAARGRLSGLLIGAELAAARPYWLGQDVALIGAGPLVSAYADALAMQGVSTRQLAGSAAVVAGLAAAFGKVSP